MIETASRDQEALNPVSTLNDEALDVYQETARLNVEQDEDDVNLTSQSASRADTQGHGAKNALHTDLRRQSTAPPRNRLQNWIRSPFKSIVAKRAKVVGQRYLTLGVQVANEAKFAGNVDGLTEAIAYMRNGIAKVPPTGVRYAVGLNDLAYTLRERRQRGGGQPDDLEESISLYRQALEHLPAPLPGRSTSLINLANALWTRFMQGGGERRDLEEVITLRTEVLELHPAPHPNRSSALAYLANALFVRITQNGGQKSDFEEVIALYRQALDLRPAPHSERPASLTLLANAMLSRFQQGCGQQSDFEVIVFLQREALRLSIASHPDRHRYLNNLANALHAQYTRGRGQRSDYEEIISLHREALKLVPASHPDRPMSLDNLADALFAEFQHYGQQSDLDEILKLQRESLKLRPPPHPNRPMALGYLARGLFAGFDRGFGQQSDLEEIISLLREGLELCPAPNPIRHTSLNNLAYALLARYTQGGRQGSDFKEIISLHRQALELLPAPHPDRARSLNNLANALLAKFALDGQPDDIEEIISLQREALELHPAPHPNRPYALTYLANALLTRITHDSERRNDFEEVITLYQQALDLRPAPNPYRSTSLDNLAHALLTRLELKVGQQSDLEKSISLHRQAVQLLPVSSPHRFRFSDNLAKSISTRLERTGDRGDLEEVILIYGETTHSPFLPASQRFKAALQWIQHASQHQHSSVLEGHDAALQLLPQLAALSLNIQSRQNALSTGSDGLARRAARCAIQNGSLDKAVEYLETGRGVFWSQAMRLRSPLDRLCDIAPELGNRLRVIAAALDRGSHRDTPLGESTNRERMTLEEEASQSLRHAEEWRDGLEEVRNLQGFEDFLLPHRFSSLQIAAEGSPIVILVANDEGSDCLIVTSTIVHHIPIPNLPNATLRRLVRLVSVAASGTTIKRSSVRNISEATPALSRSITENILSQVDAEDLEVDRGGRLVGTETVSSEATFKGVLRILWDEVVKPVVDLLVLQEDAVDMPVLQWCPTGQFTFLPVHAAGNYTSGMPLEYASEYFISSYTPSISALLLQSSSETEASSSTQPFNMMAVIQTQSLPSTLTELENIKRHVPNESLIVFGGPGDTEPSVEAVASRLSEASVVHFACHGIQNRSNPLESGLQLESAGGVRLITIARVMKERMRHGTLAFLSACETAKGDQNLPDEAMNLGASLIFSGFRRVVATMWEIRDSDGPIVADAFYEELSRGPEGQLTSQPDCTKSALALQVAVKKLRSQGAPFHRWVPFIHMGQ